MAELNPTTPPSASTSPADASARGVSDDVAIAPERAATTWWGLKKSTWVSLAKYGVALAIVCGLVWRYRVEITDVWNRPKDWRWFGAAMGLCGVATLLTFFRWYLLVWAQELPFRLGEAVRLGFVGLLANFVMPGTVGGDVVKAYLIARRQSQRSIAVATVLMDRYIGLLALFYVGALVAGLFWPRFAMVPRLPKLMYVLWLLALGATVMTTVLLIPSIYRWRWVARLTTIPLLGRLLAGLFQAMTMYRRKVRIVILVTVLSVVCHLGFIGAFYCVAQALRGGPGAWSPDLLEHYLIMPLAIFVGAVVPTPAGMGGTEGAVFLLYGWLASASNVPVEEARGQGLFNSLAYRIIQLVIAVSGAVYYFRARREMSRAVE